MHAVAIHEGKHALPPNLQSAISNSTVNLMDYLQSHRQGTYMDGHEREDVVKSREEFLKKLK